ncbi:MAG TPA: efflux RND transporter periplasmic adaptor subunit [Terriglobales bacterium]|nr:efflux RND transporter periplasmic adaptor subunit [Terriglobales bacterium]
MKILKSKWMIAAGVVLAVAVFAAFTLGRGTQQQFFTSKAELGSIHDTVQATGTINAVISVQVGSQVSGTISKLYADFNSKVKKGQVIAQIEPSLFQGAVLQAEADLQNAVATEAASKAELLKAQAAAAQATADYQRNLALSKEGIISAQAMDISKATADSDVAAVQSAQAQVKQATAQVAMKKAALTVAQTNLDHTTIRSPIDGTVVARSVDVGQTVAASLQAPTLFTIAQDLTRMQVDVSTDESDVGSIKVGLPVTFQVDAFPKQTFQGTVMQVRMNPTTVQNVVTYDTVVAFDNPELKLFPGMTAYVTVPVADASNVIKVANAALRFKPDMQPDAMQALYQKYGIDLGAGSKGRAQKNGAAQQSRPAQADMAVIWKVSSDKSLQPVQIRTGITDHTYTEVAQVVKGDLQAGDQLATGAASSTSTQQKSSSSAPGMGSTPRMGGR